MNYWLILGPVGMILIGLITITYWWRKHKVKLRLFTLGGLLWLITVVLKAVMDALLTTPIFEYLNNGVQILSLLILSIIVGLRTGLFESGISYVIIKLRIKKIKWKESIAVGIGFGASEALVLGLLNLITMLVLINPEILTGLSEAERLLVQSLFNQSTLIVLATWLERGFVLLVHVFATALVIKAITTKNLNYLWLSIIYKTMVDLPIPYFQLLMGQGSIIITFLTELYVVGAGLAGLYGLKWLKKKKK